MSERNSNIQNVPGPIKNPQTSRSPGKNKNIAYPLKDYIGENLLKRSQDKEGFSKPVKDHEGIVLFVAHIPLEVFMNSFDANFITTVLKTKTPTQKRKGVNYVNEAIVYIPEISGCLPLPDMTLVEGFIASIKKEKQASDVNTIEKMNEFIGENKKNQSSKNFRDVSKQLRRMDRMPRFYCIDQFSNGAPLPNKRVQVKFPNESDFTKGILKEVY